MDSEIQSSVGAQCGGAVRSMKRSATVTAKDGLLWRHGKIIPLPEADRVARDHGYQNAEQLVRALEANGWKHDS